MVNVQQVYKHHDLFKISLARGFSDPDCEQSTHTLDPSCTYLVAKHKYVKTKKYGKFGCLNYEAIHVMWKDGTLLYF